MLSALWMWPRLRMTKFWLTASVVTCLGTAVLLGLDVQKFLDRGGASSKTGVRLLYKLFREIDRPVIPFATGCLAASLFSFRSARSEGTGHGVHSDKNPPVAD